jgi:hypothetical protein
MASPIIFKVFKNNIYIMGVDRKYYEPIRGKMFGFYEKPEASEETISLKVPHYFDVRDFLKNYLGKDWKQV